MLLSWLKKPTLNAFLSPLKHRALMQPVIAMQLMPYLSAVDLHNCLVVFPSWEIFARRQILLDNSEDATWAKLADFLENGGNAGQAGCPEEILPVGYCSLAAVLGCLLPPPLIWNGGSFNCGAG